MTSNALRSFEAALTPTELDVFRGMDDPVKIQAFLDTVAYSTDHFYRCPLRLMHERIGHCFDGALFAATALRRIGYPPLILEIIPNDHDDDHLLAVFKFHGHWGAVAQSNFANLRYRHPVYRSLRELVMSYFSYYFNDRGEMTMLGYRQAINFSIYDKLDWMTSDKNLDFIGDDMDRYKIHRVVTDEMLPLLAKADDRILKSNMIGTKVEGLFIVSEEDA
jgi:hypothetical protein